MNKNRITNLILVLMAFLQVGFVAAGDKGNIIGVNTNSLSLYSSPTASKKTKKLPKSDFAAVEILDVSPDGKRYQVNIDNNEWWVKKRQVKTDKKYEVGACSQSSDASYAAVRGAGECNSN